MLIVKYGGVNLRLVLHNSDTTNSVFTYDAANKPLTEAVPGPPTVTYTYDALGRRASRAAGSATAAYGFIVLRPENVNSPNVGSRRDRPDA